MFHVKHWVVLAVVAAGCGGSAGVVEPEEAVLYGKPPTVTPAEPVEGVIRCDVVRTATSICWIVVDSVGP